MLVNSILSRIWKRRAQWVSQMKRDKPKMYLRKSGVLLIFLSAQTLLLLLNLIHINVPY